MDHRLDRVGLNSCRGSGSYIEGKEIRTSMRLRVRVQELLKALQFEREGGGGIRPIPKLRLRHSKGFRQVRSQQYREGCG